MNTAGFPAAPRRQTPQPLRVVAYPALLALLAAVAGCGPKYDPLMRDGLWRPMHVNRANLVMQVANPADLVRGTGTTTSDGQLAALAVERLRNDKIKPLPAAGLAEVSATNSGANNTGGGQ
jgi:hypothetical protein